MDKSLQETLDRHSVVAIYAAEAGSRAWGYANKKSDYDVRFVFASHREKYLSLRNPVETLEFSKESNINYAGWDLKKALLLAKNSNPALCEWLQSPEVYLDKVNFRAELFAIMQEHFSPSALAHHYVSFMKNTRGKSVDDFTKEPTLKKYLYAVRPILCLLHLTENQFRLPPITMEELLQGVELSVGVRREIEFVLESRRLNADAPIILESLEPFINQWFEWGRAIARTFESREVPVDLLDELFLSTLDKIENS